MHRPSPSCSIPPADISFEAVFPGGAAPADLTELLEFIEVSEDVLLVPRGGSSRLLKPSGKSLDAAVALRNRKISVPLADTTVDVEFRLALPLPPLAVVAGGAGVLFRAIPDGAAAAEKVACAWDSLPAMITRYKCGVEITPVSADGVFALGSGSSLPPDLAATALLRLGPVKSRGVTITFERVAPAPPPPPPPPAVVPDAVDAVPPLGIDRVVIWHDVENMPLPSRVIVRDERGLPKLGPPQPPSGKRFVEFAPLRKDRSDEIKGAVVIAESLRVALSCVAPGGAAHPALAVEGVTLKNSLAAFEYRVFLQRNDANPFHPSLCESRLPAPRVPAGDNAHAPCALLLQRRGRTWRRGARHSATRSQARAPLTSRSRRAW